MSTTFILVSLFLSLTYAAVRPSPDAVPDPLSGRMLVSSAGSLSVRSVIPERQVFDGMTICPNDYPQGFSLRCDAASDSDNVQFFVNGKPFADGKSAFIAGHDQATEVVTAWRPEITRAYVGCKVGTEEFSASIRIAC